MAPVFPDEASLGRVAGRFAASGLVLDAGREGASAAFGTATVVNWSLFLRSLAGAGNGANTVESVSPRMLWHFGCLQEGPDVDEFGVGCRSVLDGWHHHGACAESLWPSAPARGDAPQPRGDWQRDAAKRPLVAYYRVEAGRIADLQFALTATGVLLVSLVAHEGWKLADSGRASHGPISHRSLPTIGAAPQRSRFGGHAVAVIGYDEYGLLILNTWGPGWGQHGFARLTYEQWLRFGLDAWIPILGAPVAWPAQ